MSSFGGAKAQTVEFAGVRFQFVVRSLRTTDYKRTASNVFVCAFAPPEKRATSDILHFPMTTPVYITSPIFEKYVNNLNHIEIISAIFSSQTRR